ncbi:hypothetical protein QM012_003737 [Aureobasidium pullulans]|uniref:Uncharacterized protein n=1 Tax=Aureobasidium pullulans TaxID=5580 RepID=A0ABR0T926_AURPU
MSSTANTPDGCAATAVAGNHHTAGTVSLDDTSGINGYGKSFHSGADSEFHYPGIGPSGDFRCDFEGNRQAAVGDTLTAEEP